MRPARNLFDGGRVRKPMVIVRVFALLTIAAVFAAPQDQPQATTQQQPETPAQERAEQQVPPTFRATVNVVVAPTTVTDRDGNFVPGLNPGDFRLLDNGKPQDIKVDTSYNPISLVIAVQANASAEPALDAVRKIGPMIEPLVIGEQGEVALIAFDHRIQVLQDFTSNTGRVEDALQKLKPGSTASRLTDAVVEASRMLSKRPQNRRRILLLVAETRDVNSNAKTRQALTDLQFDNVIVYSVNMSRLKNTLMAKPEPPRPDPLPPGARPLPPGVPNTPSYTSQVYGNPTNSGDFIPVFVEIFKATKAIFVDNPVEVYTRWTGGKEHSFGGVRDLERAISAIGTELHSQYVISYVPNNRDEGGFHDIKIQLVNRNLKVRARPGYWVASQPNP